MYRFHGWVVLSDDTYETSYDLVEAQVPELLAVARQPALSVQYDVVRVNLDVVLTIHGLPNRRRHEADVLDRVLAFIAERLPGSYGVVYIRDDERTTPPGVNAFEVRVIRRGMVEVRDDPFLSPCNPVIED